MSVYVSAWVWKHSQAKGSTRLVLLALADQADDDGEIPPYRAVSLERLAEKTKLTTRAVRFCLRELEGKDSTNKDSEGGPVRPGIHPPELATETGKGVKTSRYKVLMRQLPMFGKEHDLPAEVAAEEPVDKPVENALPAGNAGSSPGGTPVPGGEEQQGHRGGTPVPPTARNDVKARRDTLPPPPPAAPYNPSPEIITWAALNSYAGFIDLHTDFFRDYLTAHPEYARKHAKTLDACFRNCVRSDWGDVRMKAQRAARVGQGVDLERWWLSSPGVIAYGAARGIKWDPEAMKGQYAKFEMAVVEAAVEHDGWGAWVDPVKRKTYFDIIVARRKKANKDVPEEEAADA